MNSPALAVAARSVMTVGVEVHPWLGASMTA